MNSPYFTGSSVAGPVRAFEGQSFRDVVDEFRSPPTLPVKRAAFLALPKAERDEWKKKLSFFTPACFKTSPSRRKTEDATHCNLIFLDLDEERDGSCPAAPFFKNPKALYTALEGFDFAAYTTASSTPEKPRMRIVVSADSIPIELYPQAVASVAALLGIVRTNTESLVAVQPMFFPNQFSDSTEEDHPLTAFRHEEKRFKVVHVTAEVPDTFGKNGASGQAPYGEDAIFFLRAPLPEITLAIAKEALSKIDPDCGYFEWLEVAAALRHQFSPHYAEEAYEIFDEWSATGNSYGGEDETRAKWKSLRPTPVGRMPVTIRTLLSRAVAAGWNDQKVKQTSVDRLLVWMGEVESGTQLLGMGVKRILAAPLISPIQEGVLLGEIRKQAKKRFFLDVSLADIRKEMQHTKNVIRAQERAAEGEPKEPSWAKGVIYVSNANEMYRRRTGEKYKELSFNSCYSRFLLPTEEDLVERNLPTTAANLCKPIVEPYAYALDFLKVTTVTDYDYDPSQPMVPYFTKRGVKYVNTYSPSYPEVDPANAAKAGAMLHHHLGHLITEPEYRRILIDFMAFMVQFPGRKIRWAVLLQGAEGAGKTFFAKVMQAVLGFEHVKILSDGAIKSGYTEWSFGHQLVAVEEIYAAGVNRHAIMDTIKPLITNDDISVDEKYRNNRQANNITNYMLFSNRHDALALTPNDRRYFVVKSALQTKQQILALGDDYFEKLFTFVREFAGALRSFLMDWDIADSFRPDGHAPRTTYVQELINDSASDTVAAVRRLISEGDSPLVQYDIVSAKTLQLLLTEVEGLHNVTGQQLAHVLREEGYTQIGRHAFGEERHYLWVRAGVDQNTAAAEAAERVRRDLKNLCMELLFS